MNFSNETDFYAELYADRPFKFVAIVLSLLLNVIHITLLCGMILYEKYDGDNAVLLKRRLVATYARYMLLLTTTGYFPWVIRAAGSIPLPHFICHWMYFVQNLFTAQASQYLINNFDLLFLGHL